jgi:hypothetical protein
MLTRASKRYRDESNPFFLNKNKKIKHDVIDIDHEYITRVLETFPLYDPMTIEIDLDPDKVVGEIGLMTHGEDPDGEDSVSNLTSYTFAEVICERLIEPTLNSYLCDEELPADM